MPGLKPGIQGCDWEHAAPACRVEPGNNECTGQRLAFRPGSPIPGRS